jgi:peptidyl-prolyl cis-trans isomerase C
MKLTVLIAMLSAALAFTAQTASAAANDNTTLVVVNGVALPQIYANFVRQGRANRGGPPETLTDEAIRDAVIAAELMAQEAVRKGLHTGPTLLAAIEFQKKELLSKALIEDFVRANPISEDLVKAEYENAKTVAGTTEYRPRHILVASEKEAKDVIARLTTGKKAKFEDLAKKHSSDTSADNGGDLGWVLPANLVPEFAAVLVKMKKGEITRKPVQTKFGWHVIRMDDSRKLDFPEYDKLKNRIASQMQQLQLRKYVQELRAGARIE